MGILDKKINSTIVEKGNDWHILDWRCCGVFKIRLAFVMMYTMEWDYIEKRGRKIQFNKLLNEKRKITLNTSPTHCFVLLYNSQSSSIFKNVRRQTNLTSCNAHEYLTLCAILDVTMHWREGSWNKEQAPVSPPLPPTAAASHNTVALCVGGCQGKMAINSCMTPKPKYKHTHTLAIPNILSGDRWARPYFISAPYWCFCSYCTAPPLKHKIPVWASTFYLPTEILLKPEPRTSQRERWSCWFKSSNWDSCKEHFFSSFI